jgi:hypothetical protein
MQADQHQANEAGSARPRRPLLRYSLRTLLAAMTLLCVVLGLWVYGAERQRRAVAAIEADGGWAWYGYHEGYGHGWVEELPGPDWLCGMLGVDYFDRVIHVELGSVTGDAVLADVADLNCIERLNLKYTQVTDEGFANLARMTRLEELDASHTQVGSAGLAPLKRLARLQSLDMSDTRVDDAGLAHLSALSNLEELWLDNTKVTDAGLTHLTSLTSLELLGLEGTQVTDAGCELLRKALPNCEIVR